METKELIINQLRKEMNTAEFVSDEDEFTERFDVVANMLAPLFKKENIITVGKELKEIMLNTTRCTITEEADDINENYYFKWDDVVLVVDKVLRSGKICNKCFNIDITVNKEAFNGLCADCTHKDLLN